MAIPLREPDDRKYREYLDGKSVVLVGPAASLLGRGQGEAIDAHDVVVRLNLASPVPDDRKADIGSRTDVLYHVLLDSRHAQFIGREHTAEEVRDWKRDGVQWLVTRQHENHSRTRNIRRVLRDEIPLLTMSPRFVSQIRRRVGNSPNTGTIAIAHLLRYSIRSLLVTGFDFYATGYYPGYGGFNEAEAAQGKTATAAWGRDSRRSPHPQPGQMRYLAELYGEEQRLTFDEVASERLGVSPRGPMVTALVPMKGESERVPKKNVRPLCGKPLLYWTLAALHEATRVERVVVDTDSDEIEKLVRDYFPSTLILRRPESLYGGHVTANDLIGWEVEQVEGEHFLQTHVTNPLLTAHTIDRAVDAYFKGDGDSLFAVTEHRFRLFDQSGQPVNHEPGALGRSQDLEPLYEDNSNIYVFSRESFRAAGGRIGKRPQMFPMSKLEAIDIDYPDDFALANAAMKVRNA